MPMRRENVAAALRYLQDKADLRGRAERALSLDPQEQDLADIAVEGIASLAPGVGQALAARDVERARRANDPAGMAMASMGAVPGGRLAGLLKRYDPTRAEIFIGKTAKTYDPAAERRALEMEQAGIDRDTIWRETGTGRAFGPEWKQEISDLSAEYRPGAAFSQAVEQAKTQADQFDDALYIRNRLKSLGIDMANSRQEVENLAQNAEQWFAKTFGRPPKGGATDIAKNQTADEIQGRLAAIEKLTPRRQSFATNIGAVLQHEELKKAYPGIGNERVRMASPSELGLGVEGSYSPWEGEIKIRDDIGYQLERGKDVLLHELQHAVQQREGFARGGTTDVARQVLNEQFDREMRPFQSALNKRIEATSKSSIASRAQYAQKLKDLQQKQNIKPRELTRLSDWYQYGTRVSQELDDIGLGWQMPREKGAARDKWIQQAVKIMQRMMEEKDPAMRGIESAITPNQAKSLIRKTNKVLSETQDAAVKAAKVQEKYRELNAKSDFDLYQRLAGEAEARAVQKRMNLTPTERRQTPPWQSLDVPEQEFIFRR